MFPYRIKNLSLKFNKHVSSDNNTIHVCRQVRKKKKFLYFLFDQICIFVLKIENWWKRFFQVYWISPFVSRKSCPWRSIDHIFKWHYQIMAKIIKFYFPKYLSFIFSFQKFDWQRVQRTYRSLCLDINTDNVLPIMTLHFPSF